MMCETPENSWWKNKVLLNEKLKEMKAYYNCDSTATSLNEIKDDGVYILNINIFEENIEKIKDLRVMKAIGNILFGDEMDNLDIAYKQFDIGQRNIKVGQANFSIAFSKK